MGLMGSRMARQFLLQEFPLAVWNRTAERCRPLVDAGAKQAATPADLARGSDVVVACLADPAAVEGFIFGQDGLLGAVRPGFRYVESSTISANLSRRIAQALQEKGADMLEAPMTGSKLGAERGTLLFMTGGSQALHDELMPVLMAMGAKAIRCGDVGDGAVVKLIGNTVISFMVEGFCEGIVAGRKLGIPLATIVDVIQASGFASPYYAFKGKALAERDFEQHFSIDLMAKDQGLMLAEAHQAAAPMPGLAAIREVFQAARGQGSGQEDIVAIIKVLEKAAGVSDPAGPRSVAPSGA